MEKQKGIRKNDSNIKGWVEKDVRIKKANPREVNNGGRKGMMREGKKKMQEKKRDT